MPFTRVLLVSNDQQASPFSFTCQPLPLKLFTVTAGKLAVALLAIFRVPAFIERSVFPLVNAETMFFAINESAFVDFAIFVLHDALGRCQIVVGELSLVLPVISFVLASSVLLACHILSFINR